MQLDHSTILDYSERNGWSGILVAMDFEKAFDSLDFDFRALHKFNIAPPPLPSLITFFGLRGLYKHSSSWYTFVKRKQNRWLMNAIVLRYTKIHNFKAIPIYLKSWRFLKDREIADQLDNLQPVTLF